MYALFVYNVKNGMELACGTAQRSHSCHSQDSAILQKRRPSQSGCVRCVGPGKVEREKRNKRKGQLLLLSQATTSSLFCQEILRLRCFQVLMILIIGRIIMGESTAIPFSLRLSHLKCTLLRDCFFHYNVKSVENNIFTYLYLG